jgi:methylthioribose-1-phosphate isomerase
MLVNGHNYRTVWFDAGSVFMVDQNRLPFEFAIHECRSCADTCDAIRTMVVRGAGAVGAAAGFAMAQSFLEAPDPGLWEHVAGAQAAIEATRPTAQNLFFATNAVVTAARQARDPRQAAVAEAQRLADQDAATSRRIGEHGAALIGDGAGIATHCNAGCLAFVDYGTALAPLHLAHAAGKRFTVYVDETRPRGQGTRLTAWELHNASIEHVIIADNALAALMSQGAIDLMIVGADRIAMNGDVANKIGTLEKAIVANAFGVPFYVAAPIATIDPACPDGSAIPIEERAQEEVLYQTGRTADGRIETVLVASPGSPARNPAFDVTPARYVTGLITEAGIIPPRPEAIAGVVGNAPRKHADPGCNT